MSPLFCTITITISKLVRSTAAGQGSGLYDPPGGRLPDGVDLEADLPQLVVRQDVPSVEDEGRLAHELVDLLVVQGRELVPLRGHGDRVRTLSQHITLLFSR